MCETVCSFYTTRMQFREYCVPLMYSDQSRGKVIQTSLNQLFKFWDSSEQPALHMNMLTACLVVAIVVLKVPSGFGVKVWHSAEEDAKGA